MATIKRIIRSNPLSAPSQVAPTGNAAIWDGISSALDSVYKQILPAAVQQSKEQGAQDAHAAVRARFGQGGSTNSFADAIGSIESGGNYEAVGPKTKSGDQAYGKFQVMGANVGPWTKKWYGKELTPQQFLKDPKAQVAVFNGQFGSYVDKYGNPQDAASAWFSGRPMAKAGNSSDGYNTVPEYVQKFNAALGSSSGTTVTDGQGQAVLKSYSPYSGPVLRAHDAAAAAAYTSDIQNKASVDLIQLSAEFPMNPDGFSQASQAYIDKIVADSPAPFRAGIRDSLSITASRRTAGLMADRQTDIRTRAVNGTKATIDRLSGEYSQLRAIGDTEGAAAVLNELNGALGTLERLPGASWTPAQSELTIAKADTKAGVIAGQNHTKRVSGLKKKADLAIAAAKNGQTSADEGSLLNDPSVAAAIPDKISELKAYILLRDKRDGFSKLTPDAQKDAVTAAKERLVTSSGDVVLAKGLSKLTSDNAATEKKQNAAAARKYKKDAAFVIAAAKNGQTAAGEQEFLNDPKAAILAPDEVASAKAYIHFRDQTPDFKSLPPSEQNRMVKDWLGTRPDIKADVSIVKAAETVARENAAAWKSDPIKRATEVLDTPPPVIPTFDPTKPDLFSQAIADRVGYAHTLQDNGYTQSLVPFSKDELAGFSLVLSKDVPPEVRLSIVTAMTQGLGADSMRVFDSLKIDSVTRSAAKMLLSGGSPEIALVAMKGQQMLDEGLVTPPPSSDMNTAVNGAISTALDGVPGMTKYEGEIKSLAIAIYAAGAQGVDPKSTNIIPDIEAAVQKALGQSKNVSGSPTGGVQDVMGHPTLLPAGVSTETLSNALRVALGGKSSPTFGEGYFSTIISDSKRKSYGKVDKTLWKQVADGKVPSFRGQPIDKAFIDANSVRIIPAGGDMYRMEVITNGGKLVVTDQKGDPFAFNIKKFLEAD